MSDRLEALRASAAHLAEVAAPLTGEQLRQQAYPTEWTVADTLSHLGSGAVIMRTGFERAIAGEESDSSFMQGVWDEWNAKSPEDQAAGVVEADAALLAALDATDDAARASFTFPMGPMQLDFDSFLGLRLNEHALHTWDVETAFVSDAKVLPVAVPEVLGTLTMIAGFSAKASGEPRTIRIATSEPDEAFDLAVGAEKASLASAAEDGAADASIELPAEAFVRLVYGRLDPDHAPAGAEGPVLDDLRTVFPGF